MNNIFLNVALILCHNSQTLNKIFHIYFLFIDYLLLLSDSED